MDTEIGISGGSVITALGSFSEVKDFFQKINLFLNESGIKMPLVTERLFKKYIKQSENQLLLDNLDELFLMFNRKDEKDYLNFFKKIRDSIECAKGDFLFFSEQGIPYTYQPVMIVVSSIPELIIQQNISLETRDSLTEEDKPFWFRD